MTDKKQGKGAQQKASGVSSDAVNLSLAWAELPWECCGLARPANHLSLACQPQSHYVPVHLLFPSLQSSSSVASSLSSLSAVLVNLYYPHLTTPTPIPVAFLVQKSLIFCLEKKKHKPNHPLGCRCRQWFLEVGAFRKPV